MHFLSYRRMIEMQQMAERQQEAVMQARREAAERLASLDGKTFKCGPWRWRAYLQITTVQAFGTIHPKFKLRAERIEP